jgi:hypothetical protein
LEGYFRAKLHRFIVGAFYVDSGVSILKTESGVMPSPTMAHAGI